MFLKRKAPRLVIGLSFAKDAVYAVAVHALPSDEVVVEQAVTVPLPPSALGDRDISEPSLVTDAVKKALAQMPTSSPVVIGLPSPATIAHAITLPVVAPKERRAIVHGEIDLLNLLPPGQEAFDFVVFTRPEAIAGKETKDTKDKTDAAFFFAAEQHIVEQFRSCVVDAGAQVVGMEPGEYAAVRTAHIEVGDAPVSLTVSLGAHHTYLQFFLSGQPAYARRLDMGAEQLGKVAPAPLPTAQALDPEPVASTEPVEATEAVSLLSGISAAPTLSSFETVSAPPPLFQPAESSPLSSIASPFQNPDLAAPGNAPSPLFPGFAGAPGFSSLSPEEAVRERMLSEIARSIDYFGREFNQDTADMPVVLLANTPSMLNLLGQAANILEQNVTLASYLDTIPLSEKENELALAAHAAYAPALGLALGHVRGKTLVPTFDLSREAAEAARKRRAPRQLVTAISASAILVALGCGTAFLIQQQTDPVVAELDNTQKALEGLNLREQQMRTDNLQEMELVRQIRMQNLPWTNVLRNVALAVPNGVGITRVSVQSGALSITGETTDTNRVVQFWSRMNTSPFFAGATVTSMQRGDDRYTFQMSVQLPSSSPAGAAPAGATAAAASGAKTS